MSREIERREVQRTDRVRRHAAIAASSSSPAAARHRDHAIAGRRQLSGDRQADAAAGAGDEDIIHGAPAFRRRSPPARGRSAASAGTL